MTIHRLLGEGLDRLVLRTMNRIVGNADYAVSRTEGESFLIRSGLGDPSRFFPTPSQQPPQQLQSRLLEEQPRYVVNEVRLPSPVATAPPPNDLMAVRRFCPRICPRGRVVVLHGAMVSSRLPWDRLARQLAKRGIEALVPSMPDHYERTPSGEYSGQYLIGGHLPRGLDIIRQGVTDVRSLVRRLRQEGDQPVGLVGFSMGGLIGGWTIALEPLDFAVLAEPAVELDPIVFETPLGKSVRHSLGQAGWSEQEVREWLRALSPLWADSLLPPERLMLMLPEYDCFVPPHAVERAWQRWGQPQLRRYPAGHISIFLLRSLWKDILAFVEQWCEPDVWRIRTPALEGVEKESRNWLPARAQPSRAGLWPYYGAKTEPNRS